jgi:zinc transporter 1/2/3
VPYVSSSPTSQVENTEEHNHDEVFHEDLSTLRSFLLLFALTFHSIFEGLAIGTQPDTMSLLQIFIAVIVHKSIMAFSLGLNLSQSAGMTVKTFMIANLVFSISSPLGMGLGIGISHLHKSLAKDIANGTLQVLLLDISLFAYNISIGA